MRDVILSAVAIAAIALLSGCQSPTGSPGNAATTTVPVQGGQTVTGGQRQATGTETGSATNTVSPSIDYFIGMKTIKITRSADGAETIEAEGVDDGSITISGAQMGIQFGNEGQRASVESGQSATGSEGATSGPRGGGQ